MKKYLTLANAFKAAGLLLALIAFLLMFSKQLCGINELTGSVYKIKFSEAMFDRDYGAGIAFVGYLFILIGGLGGVGLIFLPVDAKIKKIIAIALAVLMVLGVIFISMEPSVFNHKFTAKTVFVGGYYAAGGPITAMLLGMLGGFAVGLSEFVPEKELLK